MRDAQSASALLHQGVLPTPAHINIWPHLSTLPLRAAGGGEGARASGRRWCSTSAAARATRCGSPRFPGARSSTSGWRALSWCPSPKSPGAPACKAPVDPLVLFGSPSSEAAIAPGMRQIGRLQSFLRSWDRIALPAGYCRLCLTSCPVVTAGRCCLKRSQVLWQPEYSSTTSW
jgi:hypothetical protein